MCSKNAFEKTRELFGEEALFISYTDPGYFLFKEVEKGIEQYSHSKGSDPKTIFLENHGVFMSADDPEEIFSLYKKIKEKIKGQVHKLNIEALDTPHSLTHYLPSIRMMLSDQQIKTLKIRNNTLIQSYLEDKAHFEKISRPFTPDMIIYCKSSYLFITPGKDIEATLAAIKEKIKIFRNQKGFDPHVILIKGIGMITVGENASSAETIAEVYEDLIKVNAYAENFGGPKPMNGEQIAFIDNWEVENYRRKMAKGATTQNKSTNRIAIVTGGSQGFGEGISKQLFNQGVNLVIADIKEEQGQRIIEELNNKGLKNRALFIKTDISEDESVKNLIYETVKAFGGLDIFISNAGILKARGLDEMNPGTFELMTKINYTGYFLYARHASTIIKKQAAWNNDFYMDIIQINSKSGLKGSKKNFAYAGAKFGGVGLTESFALELMPDHIKVNSICPGNFFEGPLWSDPENGLFVQYLKAGKVPGAKTIEEVKKHYESQVPAGRGYKAENVMKAINYIIEQDYETGQAIPVTGEQNMLK